jgi:hypothetical protein
MIKETLAKCANETETKELQQKYAIHDNSSSTISFVMVKNTFLFYSIN